MLQNLVITLHFFCTVFLLSCLGNVYYRIKIYGNMYLLRVLNHSDNMCTLRGNSAHFSQSQLLPQITY